MSKMVKKEREVPSTIRKLEAALRRLPPNHKERQKISDELSIAMAGFRGEQSVDYYLSYLSESNIMLLHGLRLHDKEYAFQMDTLLVSPCFQAIIEIKYMAGTLFFDQELKQLIQTYEGQEKKYLYPETQMNRQRGHLVNWLAQKKFPPMPIKTLAVISHPKAIIKASNNPRELAKSVVHSENLRAHIDIFHKNYQNKILDRKDIKRLIKQYIQSHTPKDSTILAKFDIKQQDYLKGVHCPSCFSIPMKKGYGVWSCEACGHSATNEVILDSLVDYGLLIYPSITNSQFREFFEIRSPETAWHILKSLNLAQTGDKKARVYHIPINR